MFVYAAMEQGREGDGGREGESVLGVFFLGGGRGEKSDCSNINLVPRALFPIRHF